MLIAKHKFFCAQRHDFFFFCNFFSTKISFSMDSDKEIDLSILIQSTEVSIQVFSDSSPQLNCKSEGGFFCGFFFLAIIASPDSKSFGDIKNKQTNQKSIVTVVCSQE